jgi:hypothetical protein
MMRLVLVRRMIMSTTSSKASTMGALLLGAALSGLVAGSSTPAQAGIANASLGTSATTAADIAGVPINASIRIIERVCRRTCRRTCRRRVCKRTCRIIVRI